MKSWFPLLWRFRASVALALLLSTLIWADKDSEDEEETTCGDDMLICSLVKFGILEPNPRSWNPGPGLPLAFEPNLGQAGSTVEFLAQGKQLAVYLSSGNAFLTLDEKDGQAKLRATLEGASPRAQAEPEEILPGQSNYLLGNDSSKWITNVPSFRRVRYRDVYPGIDVVYYGHAGELEHDFIVRPGADPSRIRMALHGAAAMSLNAAGDIVVQAGERELLWKKPVVYQEVRGARRLVESRYRLDKGAIAFELGRFDPDRNLVIDPIVTYSTYIGKLQPETMGRTVTDNQGNVYMLGISYDRSFPVTSGAFQSQVPQGGFQNVLLMKVNPSSNQAVYSTYIGGSFHDQGVAIAVDNSGAIYLAGSTASTDFPVTQGVVKTRFSPPGLTPADQLDCYVTKLSPGGNALVYSTFLGGTRDDSCMSVAVDSQGNAVVGGTTASFSNFPFTRGAAQENAGGGGLDGFVAKLNPTATSLLYATFLGGSGIDSVFSLALDSQGAAYVTGQTTSTAAFPVTDGSAQTRYGGNVANAPTRLGDAFVVKLNPAGSRFDYGTYLGGSGDDAGFSIAVDGQGNAHVAGTTNSANFPTTSSAPQTRYGGSGRHVVFPAGDAFAAKLNSSGTTLMYSTYLGGSQDDWGMALALDRSGNAWLTGATLSPDFPVSSDATQKTFKGPAGASSTSTGDAWVAQLSSAGNAVLFATYLGGSQNDYGLGLAVDGAGNATVSGGTISTDFPVTSNAAQSAYGGTTLNTLPMGDGFLTRFGGSTSSGGILSVGAVVSAASYAGGGVAPGEIAVITGGGIGPAQLTTLALTPQGTVATTLSETRVTFDGVAAPVLYASSGQTSVIVPYEINGKQSAQMVVEYRGGRSAPLTVPVVQSKPALFSANASGRGQGAILNADFSYNSSTNPVAKGGIVLLFGTGEGPIDPPGVTGRVNSAVFPRILLPATVTIGGQNARVLYAGAAPGQVGGLFQMNVEVPQGVASGNQEVIVTIGNTRSQSGVTVAVQ